MGERTEYLPGDIHWSDWGGIFLDVERWRPVVGRIVWAEGLGTVEKIEAGYPGTCAVFVVNGMYNGAYVVKVYPPMLPLDGAKEQQVYRLLDGRVDLLPTLLGAGVYPDRIDWPYLVLAFSQGTPIREVYAQLDSADKVQIAQQVGSALRTVHTTAISDAPPLDAQTDQWLAFLQRRRIDCMAELRQAAILSESILVEIETFLDAYLAVRSRETVRPVLLHADLTEDHLLLVNNDERGWHASALLDWADAEAGAPAYEWVALWFGLCHRDQDLFYAVLKAYNPTLALDESFYRECLAYTFLHRFGPGIIEHAWRGDGSPNIASLYELQQWLWLQPATQII